MDAMKEKVTSKGQEIMGKSREMLTEWEEKSRDMITDFLDMFGRDGRLVSLLFLLITLSLYIYKILPLISSE